MPKQVMLITCSPRKGGNTETLSTWVAQGLEETGAKVETINAATLKYKTNGCIACYKCQEIEEYRCVIDDEASPILERMGKMDLIIFATPIYFFGFSAQMKLLLDRTFSHFKFSGDNSNMNPDLKNTKFALIASAGDGDEGGLKLTENTFKDICAFMKKDYKYFSLPFAPGNCGQLLENDEIKTKAIAFGKELG